MNDYNRPISELQKNTVGINRQSIQQRLETRISHLNEEIKDANELKDLLEKNPELQRALDLIQTRGLY